MPESQAKGTCAPVSGASATPALVEVGASAPDLEPVTITTNLRHLQTIRSVLLEDLSKQLERAAESVHELGETPAPFGLPRAHDVRSQVSWIVETVETLDSLGWAREAGWTGYRA